MHKDPLLPGSRLCRLIQAFDQEINEQQPGARKLSMFIEEPDMNVVERRQPVLSIEDTHLRCQRLCRKCGDAEAGSDSLLQPADIRVGERHAPRSLIVRKC